MAGLLLLVLLAGGLGTFLYLHSPNPKVNHDNFDQVHGKSLEEVEELFGEPGEAISPAGWKVEHCRRWVGPECEVTLGFDKRHRAVRGQVISKRTWSDRLNGWLGRPTIGTAISEFMIGETSEID